MNYDYLRENPSMKLIISVLIQIRSSNSAILLGYEMAVMQATNNDSKRTSK